MRILVCGGRDFTDKDALYRALDDLYSRREITSVVFGCANGADKFAGKWAASLYIHGICVHADWKRYGKAAGPMRNQYMIDEYKPVECVAFPGGRGTADMIARCKKAGIPVWEPMKVVDSAG